jgi:hypothetical protein
MVKGALQAGIDTLDAVIADAVAAHLYVHLLADLPRIGTLNLAQIIGEVGPILERVTSFDQLTAETSIAPVARACSRTHTVAFRHDDPPTRLPSSVTPARLPAPRWHDPERLAGLVVADAHVFGERDRRGDASPPGLKCRACSDV